MTIYQGEHELADDNFELGSITLGSENRNFENKSNIEVTFTVAADGTLCVVACDETSNNSSKLELNLNGRLSKEEMQEIILKAAREENEKENKKKLLLLLNEKGNIENNLRKKNEEISVFSKDMNIHDLQFTVQEDKNLYQNYIEQIATKSENEKSLTVIAEQKSTIVRLQQEIINVQDALQTNKEELKTLIKKGEQSDEKMRKLLQENENLKKTIEESKYTMDEDTELRGKYEKLKITNDEINTNILELTKKHDNITKQLQETEQKLKQNVLTEEKDIIILHEEHIQMKLGENSQEIKKLVEESMELKSKLEELPELKLQISKLSLELAQKDEQYEENMKFKDLEIDELIRKLKTAEGELSDIKSKPQKPALQVKKVMQEHHLNFENKLLRNPTTENSPATKMHVSLREIEKIKIDNNPFKLRDTIEKLVSELNSSRAEIIQLKYENDILKDTEQNNCSILELDKLKEEINELQLKIVNKDLQISKLEKESEHTQFIEEK